MDTVHPLNIYVSRIEDAIRKDLRCGDILFDFVVTDEKEIHEYLSKMKTLILRCAMESKLRDERV